MSVGPARGAAGEGPVTARQTRAETRKAVLDAGLELLVERGLDPGLNLVTINDAIRASGVPRASAYRLFADHDADPQVAFRTQVVKAYVTADPMAERRAAMVDSTSNLLKNLGGHTPVEQARSLREIIRLTFLDARQFLVNKEALPVVAGSWAGAALAKSPSPEMVETFRSYSEARTFSYVPLWRQLSLECGLRLRDGLDWFTFALMARTAAAADWIGAGTHEELRDLPRPTGDNGSAEQWSLAGMLTEGLLLSCLEPDPAKEPNVDLTSWLG